MSGRATGIRRQPSRRPLRQRSGRGRAAGWLAGAAVALAVAPGLDATSLLWRTSAGCAVWMAVDGDTVRAWCPEAGPVTVRLLGFDAPEMRGRCLGETARAVAALYALRWALWTAGATLLAENAERDRYGRRLARLEIDGRDAAVRLIEAGLARPYDGGLREGWCG